MERICMEDNTGRSEYIHKYISNQLTEEERLAFELEMRKDPRLSDDVLFARQVMLAYRMKNDRLGQTEIPQPIQRMVNSAERRFKKERRRRRIIFSSSVAAAVVFLAVFLSGVFTGTFNERLFNRYYAPPAYEHIPSRSGEVLSVAQQKMTEEGNRQYEAGHYEKASWYYGKVVSDTEYTLLPPELLFYYSITLIEERQDEMAEACLSYIVDNEKLFREDAQWYLALVYVRTGRTDKALLALEEIIAEASEHATAAKKITNEIRQRK